jgi:predicted PhzF superfamily epimerase YddE/YHI9
MTTLPIYQVDAFTSEVFAGNPAAVCPLQTWLPDDVMQAIAAENNLSETAFMLRAGDVYELRWFTPNVEVDLCGHATLAAAFVACTRLEPDSVHTRFDTRSGRLNVTRHGRLYVLDFPARPPGPCDAPLPLVEALGAPPKEVLASRDYLAIYDSEDEVRALTPDHGRLAADVDKMVIVSAPGHEFDFVSRFFAPREGIPEDPVTGSAHCTLIPYWAERLGKRSLQAAQISPRGGELVCEHRDERVRIAGQAALYLEGTIHIPG